MKLIPEILEQVRKSNDEYLGGVCYINESITEKVIEDVNIITFKNLYIRVAISLFEHNTFRHNMIPISEKENIEILKKFIAGDKNIKLNSCHPYSHPNSYFAYLHNTHSQSTIYITSYMENLYKYILDIYRDNIIYIDTDTIFYKGEIDTDYIGIEFESGKFDYLIPIHKKRYVAYGSNDNLPGYLKHSEEDDNFIVKGFMKSYLKKFGVSNYKLAIKNKMREKNIDSLLD